MRLYDNSRTVADEAAILDDFQARSRQACAQHTHQSIAYGSHPRHILDSFECGQEQAPLVVFVHGGYWQWCDNTDFAFIAPPLLQAGMDVVLLEYPLTPEVTFAQVVASVGSALDALAKRPENHNREVVLCGHSAGGHLCALWQHHPLVSSVVAISGIYDLAPLQTTHLNDALRLTPADIASFSPICQNASDKPLAILYGGAELPELQWQSTHYAQHTLPNHPQASVHVLASCNHYDILDAVFAKQGWLLQQRAASTN